MSAVAIKFCGLTRDEDVALALALDVDYLGLVLAAGSPRRLSPARAAELARQCRVAPRPPRVVVLLRDPAPADVEAAILAVAPDLLQFHGDEPEAFCRRFVRPYWKALGTAGVSDLDALVAGYASAEALLLDGHAPGEAGGRGQAMAWSRWPRSERRLVLAGGLAPDNVAAALAATGARIVDVASGIESAPGIKSHQRMRDFVAAVRGQSGLAR